MKISIFFPLRIGLLALALLVGTTNFSTAGPHFAQEKPATNFPIMAQVAPPLPRTVLLANWSSLVLQNRARMIQGAFIAILLGIFILRR